MHDAGLAIIFYSYCTGLKSASPMAPCVSSPDAYLLIASHVVPVQSDLRYLSAKDEQEMSASCGS